MPTKVTHAVEPATLMPALSSIAELGLGLAGRGPGPKREDVPGLTGLLKL